MKKRYRLIASLAMMACVSLSVAAQEVNVVGTVVDRQGNPIEGALISVVDNPSLRVTTDRHGKFEINAESDNKLCIRTGRDDTKVVKVKAGQPLKVVMDFASQKVNYGFGLEQTNAESTGAVSTVYADQIDNRSTFNVGNALYGNVAGLYTMQKTGNVWDQISSMAIRGPKTLSNQGILLVVDGLERDNNYQALNYISPEEVESVSILRDAAAVALYGFRGANGVVNIVTKRGMYKSREINFSYDHGFNMQTRLPEMADAYTYASAINEALANDGKAARYSQNELNAFQSGKYPYLYPNVNWMDEVFRDWGTTDIATLTFRGGSTKMRYFTMLNLQNNRGFIKNPMASGISTQDKYSRFNFRSNLDIDLTPTTRLQTNISGVLSEFSRPSSSGDDLIGKLYTVPSAAFPVKTENGLWGGNNTWSGDYNPVYLAQGHGYSRGNTRALYADMNLRQDLSSITEGLGASVRIGYDALSSFWEDFRRSDRWGMTTVTAWENGEPSEFSNVTGGSVSSSNGSSKLDWQYRSFNYQMNVDWNRSFGLHDIYTMLLYTYKFNEATNVPLYTQSAGWYTHYGYDNRYFADFTLMFSASNKLDPNSRWKPAPTVGLSWVISNEDFMKNQNIIDFMKLRASFGIINTDNTPYDGYWHKDLMGGGSTYPVVGGNNFGNGDGGWAEARLASLNGVLEKAYKYNVGLDVSLLKGLNFSIDGFYERRSDIWVDAGGRNSSVLGISSPYVNAGIVDSWGTELGLDYSKQIGDFKLRLGGTYSFNRSKIIENLEEPKPYEYLSAVGRPIGQVWGLQAIGHFVDQADIDNSVPQQFGPVKPGDLKYKDVNNDGVVNSNDMVPMGYSTAWPEIYYGFNLGLEWKGFGFNAYFQGVANYSAWLTSSIYRPLVNNTSISQYAYENRWTPENPSARFPRLTAEEVDNNLQNSSVWLEDRSFLKLRNCEVYYKLPTAWIERIKLRNAKVYVRGTDLFSIDRIDITDPEAIGNVYPATRSIHVGLSVGI